MVIVDTSVWIDFLNDVDTSQTRWLERHLTEQRLGILDLILCEILQGVDTDDEAAEVLDGFKRLEFFSTGGRELAETAATNYRLLRSRGRTVRKTIDCLIATFCIREHHTLIHADVDFDAFEAHLGLQVVHADDIATDPPPRIS